MGACPFGETATLGHVLLRDPVPLCVWRSSCVRLECLVCLAHLVFEVPAAMELSR